MDTEEALHIKATKILSDILSTQKDCELWYYGIIIPPENNSSLSHLLGIDSKYDLLLFLNTIGLVNVNLKGECKVLPYSSFSSKNKFKISWEDFMIQNRLLLKN